MNNLQQARTLTNNGAQRSSGCGKILLLSFLVLQNAVSALMGKYTRSTSETKALDDLYMINHFIIVSEAVKLVASLIFEATTATEGLWKSVNRYIINDSKDALRMSIPAFLYLGSNTLQYVALSSLAVGVFQVAHQSKLVVTAVISVLMLKRSYSLRQWICLMVISFCTASVLIDEHKAKGKSTQTDSTVLGLTAIVLASVLSSCAGVYFEKIIKHSTNSELPVKYDQQPPSLWMRNIQLSFFSMIIAASQHFTEKQTEDVRPFFHGFTIHVWCQVFLFAGGGLLVAAVIKYADSVIKGLATGLSVFVSTAASMVLFGSPLTQRFCLLATATVIAVFYFSNPCGSTPRKLFDVRRFRSQSILFPLVLWGAIYYMTFRDVSMTYKPLDPYRSTTATVRVSDSQQDVSLTNAAVTASTGLAESAASLDGVPSTVVQGASPLLDWNTSKTALDALRTVRSKIPGRQFHEATHVLYDLRTRLGDRPVKYLEIGSYTGVSAAMMLSHPLSTSVTMVDPCGLPPQHFGGTKSQEETIRENIGRFIPIKKCFNIPWRLNVGLSPSAIPSNETFDIIFIDGDHSLSHVWSDYRSTVDLLRPGGYMVFDDYLDVQDSPQVRPAVDQIAAATDLIPLGTPLNVHGIHPQVNTSFINEYIFQKKGKFEYKPQPDPPLKPRICVVAATYQRADGSSPGKLEKIWKTLQQQTYSDWRLYLTGDHYENQAEFESLSFFNDTKASIFNLPEAGERGKYHDKWGFWFNAGLTAMNNGIERCLRDGYEWVARLDDDDYWDADHLSNIIDGIRTGATFVMTTCEFKKHPVFPDHGHSRATKIHHDLPPVPCGVVHSATAYNVAKLPSRYVFDPAIPADANMWSRIRFDDKFYPAYVPVNSCHYGGMAEKGRKWLRKDQAVPPGWYSNEAMYDYTALSTDEFPDVISPFCRYIVGPSGEGHPLFTLVTNEEDIPHEVRKDALFNGLPVWIRK